MEKWAVNWSDDYFADEPDDERPIDPVEVQAIAALREFFNANPEEVFFSRQLELRHEAQFFHWVTNRALRHLIEEGFLGTETQGLTFGGNIKLIWKKTFRYYKRSGTRVVALVSEYSMPAIAEALGDQGELMVMAGLAMNEFVVKGRHAQSYNGKTWTTSEHNLDLIVEKDGVGYGIEVKNTLPYIDLKDYKAKAAMCEFLGLRPLFAVRMMPKSWIYELFKKGGYSLVFQYQHYPWGQKELAQRVEKELRLPVRCVRGMEQGLFDRLIRWHQARVN